MATDQQGTGTVYQYFWPCCGGDYTDFFQVNGVGRTFGLLRRPSGCPTPDPQWPFTGGANFAVNPVNGHDVVISSSVGRIFSTTNQGVTWFDIGEPAVFGSPAASATPWPTGSRPNAPEGIGNLGNFIYVGTQTGQIYVTQDGGGSGTSNNWFNISLGLSGGAVQSIVTDPDPRQPRRLRRDLRGRVLPQGFGPPGEQPHQHPVPWVNITGNIHNLPYTIFGQNYNPTTDPNSIKLNQAQLA